MRNMTVSTTVLLAGLLFAGIFPYNLSAASIENFEEIKLQVVEQQIQKISITCNLNTTAFWATLLAYGIEGAVAAIPSVAAAIIILLRNGIDLTNIDNIERISPQLCANPILERIFGIAVMLEGAKACIETDQNTSVKDIFKQAFKRAIPFTACLSVAQLVSVLMKSLTVKFSNL